MSSNEKKDKKNEIMGIRNQHNTIIRLKEVELSTKQKVSLTRQLVNSRQI